MKIHSLEIKKCERFPNSLYFDFTNKAGEPFSEIVFAGENGIGKTVILNLINQALNWHELNQEKKHNRSFINARYDLLVSFTEEEINFLLKTESSTLHAIFNSRNSNIRELYLLEIDTLNSVGTRKSRIHALDSEGQPIPTRHANIQGADDQAWLSYIRALYMPPEIQFTGAPITDTKNNTVDSKTGITKFTANETQTIKQMLVDIAIGDNASITAEMQESENIHLSDSKFKENFVELTNNSRISRFKKAFNNFFETLEFVTVTNKDLEFPGEYIILFKKDNKKFDIENLSSGEKQIVYRGAFLMKDAGVKRSVIALIDEPEISLHPAWQRKIMNYYSGIIHKGEKSNNQIFIATHSPYVMQGAKEACFYILENNKEDKESKVVVTKDGRFDNWTPNQLSIEAFNLDNLYNGETAGKLDKLRKLIADIESGNKDRDDEYINLEKEIRTLVRSDDSILLAADLLELRHRIIKLQEKVADDSEI